MLTHYLIQLNVLFIYTNIINIIKKEFKIQFKNIINGMHNIS